MWFSSNKVQTLTYGRGKGRFQSKALPRRTPPPAWFHSSQCIRNHFPFRSDCLVSQDIPFAHLFHPQLDIQQMQRSTEVPQATTNSDLLDKRALRRYPHRILGRTRKAFVQNHFERSFHLQEHPRSEVLYGSTGNTESGYRRCASLLPHCPSRKYLLPTIYVWYDGDSSSSGVQWILAWFLQLVHGRQWLGHGFSNVWIAHWSGPEQRKYERGPTELPPRTTSSAEGRSCCRCFVLVRPIFWLQLTFLLGSGRETQYKFLVLCL